MLHHGRRSGSLDRRRAFAVVRGPRVETASRCLQPSKGVELKASVFVVIETVRDVRQLPGLPGRAGAVTSPAVVAVA